MMRNERALHKLAEFCWQCGSRVRGEGSICTNCGAVRVPEERMPSLAIPANGWYAPPEPFDVPKRYRNTASRPLEEDQGTSSGSGAPADADANAAAFPELSRQPTASETRRAALARWMRGLFGEESEQPQGHA